MRTPPHLLPALITPFTKAGDLDLPAHRHNLSALWERGIRGFLIAGSTGEGPYLEAGEREALVVTARQTLGKRAFLLCGVAAETVRQALGMVEEANRAGADGVLAITPTTLTRGRMGYVEAFYRDVADRSPLPVLLYSVPSVTAFELPEDLVLELADHNNIVGMKDSGGHPVRVQRLAASAPEGFLIFNGSTQAVTLAITAGAYGAITASTNYLPEKMLALVQTARRAPLGARPLQAELSRASATVETHGIPGVKAAALISGLRPGYPRQPLTALEGRATRQWREFIAGG